MSLNCDGQVFIQNTIYSYNRFVYNPAAAGTQDGTNVTLMGRLQWLGIDGAPRLFTTSVNTPLPKLQSGIGGYIIGDQLGPLSTTGVNFAYAYHFPLQRNNPNGPTLSFGASLGVLQKKIDGDFIYDTSGGIDQVVPQGTASTVVPNLGVGIYFTLPDDKLFLGISGQDLLEPSLEGLTQTSGIGPDSKVRRSIYLTGGYRFDFANRDISFQPTFLARAEGEFSTFQFDLSGYLTLKSLVVLGVSHRFYNDSFSGIAGFNVTDNLFVAYAYDYTLSDLNTNGDLASHELVLSYTFRTAKRRKSGVDNTIFGQ